MWVLLGAFAAAQDYQLLEPHLPYPESRFGSSIDVFGDLAAIGAPADGGSAYVMRRVGDTWQILDKIVPVQTFTDANFGHDVALFGEWLAVGAPGDDEAGHDAGAVYMYRKTATGDYVFHSKIFSNAPGADHAFGFSLDAGGITLCVGEPGSGDGTAQLFQPLLDSWDSFLTLHPNAGSDQDFGFAIDMDGSYVAVGAPGWDDVSPGSGRVSVFDFDSGVGTWTRLHDVTSTGAEMLGFSVAVEDTHVVAGAPLTLWNGLSTGAMVTFRVTRAFASETGIFGGVEEAEHLGMSASIGRGPDGKLRAAGGAPLDNGSREDEGSIQVLEHSTSFGWIPVTRLRAGLGQEQAQLGLAVHLDGYEILGGAPEGQYGGTETGRVHPFVLSNGSWSQELSLFGRAVDPDDHFGSAVSLHGDLAVVGAEYDDDFVHRAGSAHVFERIGQTWIHAAVLRSESSYSHRSRFGSEVDTDGERILAAAHYEEDYTGAAYVFERNIEGNWVRRARLAPNDGISNENFGTSLAIEGDMAVVGATQADGSHNGSGAAYVFERNSDGSWDQTAKLTPPGQFVGSAIALDMDAGELFVGMSDSDSVAYYKWIGGSWVPHVPPVPGAGELATNFGSSISLEGEFLAIAAFSGNRSAIHLYRRIAGNWGFAEAVEMPLEALGSNGSLSYDGTRLAAGHRRGAVAFQRFDEVWQTLDLEPDHTGFNDFPVRTAMDGANVIVGSGIEGQLGHTSIFTLDAPGPFVAYGFGDGSGSPCPCDNESAAGDEAGCLNTAGRGASLRGEGSASINADDMEMVAEGMPMNRIAQLFAGVRTTPGLPFGDGQRLVGAPIKRLGVRQADANGTARWSVDHGNFWAPGDTRYFQARYRDFGSGVCGTAFNTTAGLAVLFSD